MSYTPRLKEKYQAVIIKDLTEQFGYKSTMRVPKLTKIVLSPGMGDAVPAPVETVGPRTSEEDQTPRARLAPPAWIPIQTPLAPQLSVVVVVRVPTSPDSTGPAVSPLPTKKRAESQSPPPAPRT